MSVLTFDTHATIKNLTARGISEEHAEGIAEAIKTAQDAHLEELATKGDIVRVEAKIAETEVRIVQWVALMLLAQAGVIAALVKLL